MAHLTIGTSFAILPCMHFRYNDSRGRVGRTGAYVLVGGATLALLFFLARAPVSTLSAVSAATTPGPEMQAALDLLVTEFGDSIALKQHHLEEWLVRQRLEPRVHGRALQTPASLRALRSAAAGYRGQVNTLQSSASVLASRLILRADSLEGTDGLRHGLFAAADHALREWERDLAAYAEVQRSVAATIDSMAEFRTDAARFEELVAGLDDLVSREQRWAENVRARNPNWMLALAPADRPAFRRAPPQRSNQ